MKREKTGLIDKGTTDGCDTGSATVWVAAVSVYREKDTI